MKLSEHEAKGILTQYGIVVPRGVLIRSPNDVGGAIAALGPSVMLKAQVEVAGRGKAGGILPADADTAAHVAEELFGKKIKGLAVHAVLAEEKLSIQKEYYLSCTIDRSSKQIMILFAETGGIEIESAARTIRRCSCPSLLADVPGFMIRELIGESPPAIGKVINALYHAFKEKDALLAEINPLAITPTGIVAADAKIIIDDNALARQGITVNRDLSEREREAEKHGFSYVDLDGTIGVIGNGAGLTMATLDLIALYRGRAANFLDVGGGAEHERVTHAVRLVASVPTVKVILVNLLGGITRGDEVARGIIEADVPQKIMVRLAGTNEDEGRRLLSTHGYEMYETMDAAVHAAVEASR